MKLISKLDHTKYYPIVVFILSHGTDYTMALSTNCDSLFANGIFLTSD